MSDPRRPRRRPETARAPAPDRRRRSWLGIAIVTLVVLLSAFALIVFPRWRAAPATAAPDPATGAALTEAQAHFDGGRFERALAIAESGLERDPKAAGLHYVAGAALAEMGEHQRAVEHLRAEIETSPHHVDSRVRLASSLVELGDDQEATRVLRDAIRLDPDHARATFLLGRTLARSGERDEAEPLLRQAAENGARGAWHELGLLYQKDGDPVRAEDALRRALAAEPENAQAMFALGQMLMRNGKEEEARRFLGRHAELERKDDRLELLRHYAAEEGADTDDQVNLAHYLLLQRDVGGAIASFRKALEQDPANARAGAGLGQALLEQGQVREARSVLETAVAQAPTSAEAHFFLGLARHLERDYEGAQAALQKSRELRPWTAKEYLFLGNVLAGSGALPDAELAFRSSLETGPEIPEAHYKLALVLQARDRASEAKPELERFLELEPRDPRGPLLLGVVEHRVGDRAGAEAAFRIAIERLEVAVPDPKARQAMLGDLSALPGAPEALSVFASLRDEAASERDPTEAR